MATGNRVAVAVDVVTGVVKTVYTISGKIVRSRFIPIP